jgi:hypothetical protein
LGLGFGSTTAQDGDDRASDKEHGQRYIAVAEGGDDGDTGYQQRRPSGRPWLLTVVLDDDLVVGVRR